jgi:hypothetical protein
MKIRRACTKPERFISCRVGSVKDLKVLDIFRVSGITVKYSAWVDCMSLERAVRTNCFDHDPVMDRAEIATEVTPATVPADRAYGGQARNSGNASARSL